MLSDEPTEAQLHPDLWGLVRFSTGAGRKGQPGINMEKTLGGKEGDEFNLDDE